MEPTKIIFRILRFKPGRDRSTPAPGIRVGRGTSHDCSRQPGATSARTGPHPDVPPLLSPLLLRDLCLCDQRVPRTRGVHRRVLGNRKDRDITAGAADRICTMGDLVVDMVSFYADLSRGLERFCGPDDMAGEPGWVGRPGLHPLRKLHRVRVLRARLSAYRRPAG